ncbi:MAG: hypothetical protein ABSH06_14240 [Thermodesulfobacteriota bacterium]
MVRKGRQMAHHHRHGMGILKAAKGHMEGHRVRSILTPSLVICQEAESD